MDFIAGKSLKAGAVAPAFMFGVKLMLLPDAGTARSALERSSLPYWAAFSAPSWVGAGGVAEASAGAAVETSDGVEGAGVLAAGAGVSGFAGSVAAGGVGSSICTLIIWDSDSVWELVTYV